MGGAGAATAGRGYGASRVLYRYWFLCNVLFGLVAADNGRIHLHKTCTMEESHFGPVRLVPVDVQAGAAGKYRVLTRGGRAGQQKKSPSKRIQPLNYCDVFLVRSVQYICRASPKRPICYFED